MYYGWVVLVVGTLGLMMTTPGQTVGVSVFLDPIIDELGATRAGVSLLYTLGTLAGALALPFVGRAIARRGPRRAVAWIATGLAGACVYIATVTSLTALAIGFVLLRGLGQGALGLVSLHVISVWFVRHRGLAVGVTGVGVALATAGFPWLIEAWAGTFGWRVAYALLGALVAATILPLGIAFFRGHPERYGARPDGRAAAPGPPPIEPRFTAAEARRTATFWLLAASVACIGALSTALVFHHYDLMAARGLDRATATTALSRGPPSPASSDAAPSAASRARRRRWRWPGRPPGRCSWPGGPTPSGATCRAYGRCCPSRRRWPWPAPSRCGRPAPRLRRAPPDAAWARPAIVEPPPQTGRRPGRGIQPPQRPDPATVRVAGSGCTGCALLPASRRTSSPWRVAPRQAHPGALDRVSRVRWPEEPCAPRSSG